MFNVTGDSTSANQPTGISEANYTAVVDFFRFGQTNDGVNPGDRLNDAIYRLELEETGDNTGAFEGSMEFVLLNQINVNNTNTYLNGIDSIDDAIELIVHNDLTDEDSIRINYLDLGADGVSTQIADQIEAPTHSGVVSFDSSSYKIADTVVITLEDSDLNTDVETIDVFTVVGVASEARDQVATTLYGQNTAGENFARLLDVTFDDELWRSGLAANGGNCGTNAGAPDDGLFATGFTLVETAADSGVFSGDFQVPSTYCQADTNTLQSVTGTDMEVNYVDYRDASGEIIEVGDSAGIRANTGSVSLDRTVYPVPFGVPGDFTTNTSETPDGRSVFPVHQSAMGGTGLTVANTPGLDAGEFIANGDLIVHVRINDPDFDVSATGEDTIATLTNRTAAADAVDGPLKITVSRGADEVILATAGGENQVDGVITVLNATVTDVIADSQAGGAGTATGTQELGPIEEVALMQVSSS